MIELTMYNVRKHYGDNSILQDAGFKLFEGDRAGLTGANGSGKSTILKLLAGIEPMDIDYRKLCEGKSRILYPRGTTIAYLEQLPVYPDGLRVLDILNLAFRELYGLEGQLRDLEGGLEHMQDGDLEAALRQYSRLQQQYEAKGGYGREEKLSKVCSGLKFDGEFLQKPFDILSGGEKTTVALARILLENPDVLLLDEPTNHLDTDAAEWLEGYLKNYRGIVIIVSHDRYFLDNVVTKIIELENKSCETYNGNYTGYVRQKEESMLLQYENYKLQAKKINSMERAVKDLRDWAQRADNNKFFRRAASMQRKLDRLERIDRPVSERQSMRINFKAAGRSGHDIIKVCGLSKSFDGRVILKNAELCVFIGERIALIGPNGSGKTTFLKLLLGEIRADGGSASTGANARIAYLPQIVTFKDEEALVIDCFREDRHILEGKAREYLSRFMFFGRDPYKKVRHLSGGERVRLKLAMLLHDEVNLLILDEPTNHLDIDSIEALEEALEDFGGTLLFISHDRYFINKVCSRVVAIEDGRLASYPGNYDYYKAKKFQQRQAVEQPAALREKAAAKAVPAECRKKETIPDSLEKDIKALEDEAREIDIRMSEPGLGCLELNELYGKRAELDRRLEVMIGEWLGGSTDRQ